MSIDLAALEKPIRRILTAPGTDLLSISAKQVRKKLLQDPQYAHLRLTPEVLKKRREDVDELITRIFKSINEGESSAGSKRKRESEEVEEGGEGEGEEVDGDGEAEEAEEVQDLPRPVPKKQKTSVKKSVEESDAALARKLSSEINSRARRGAPVTAGASSSPRKPKRRAKKSAETVESEDEDEEAKPKKRGTAKGGFAKEYVLSAPLSAVLQVERLSRPQVVKKLWEYIRQHGLQNPLNKKEILCDNAFHAVFAVDKIDMFRMNKVLGQHLFEG